MPTLNESPYEKVGKYKSRHGRPSDYPSLNEMPSEKVGNNPAAALSFAGSDVSMKVSAKNGEIEDFGGWVGVGGVTSMKVSIKKRKNRQCAKGHHERAQASMKVYISRYRTNGPVVILIHHNSLSYSKSPQSCMEIPVFGHFETGREYLNEGPSQKGRDMRRQIQPATA